MSGSADPLAARPTAYPSAVRWPDGAHAAAELRGVAVRYGAVKALRGIDLELEPGRITVVLGPNGAGKTTAVRLLLGLLAPTTGTARVFGLDPRTPSARARIGTMLQVAKVPETLRVSEHIDTFRAYYPHPLPRADLIETAGLSGLERRLFGRLSGGEKQRVLFALALAGDPALLFLDEPTAGMDVETRRALWQRIRALRADGRAVLLTTHYLDEADALADRVVVLNQGQIVADGSPAEVKRTVTLRRVRCVTSLDVADIRRIAHVLTAHIADDGSIAITTAHVEQVVRALLDRDATLHGLEIGGAALEDAFLALTSGAAKEVA